MSIPCDMTFSFGTIIFYHVALTLEFDQSFENFNLAKNIWTVIGKALLYHMSISSNNTFP